MKNRIENTNNNDKGNRSTIPTLFFEWSLLVLLGALIIWVCGLTLNPDSKEEGPKVWQKHLKPTTIKEGEKLAMHETVYLPVYSHIYYSDHTKLINLAETISVRNTDLHNSIVLISVKHYGSDGTLHKEYIETPLRIEALATADFVVPDSDITGGTGANFLIEWVSISKVTEPIVESIMICTSSSHSISFTSKGEVIKKEVNIVYGKQPKLPPSTDRTAG